MHEILRDSLHINSKPISPNQRETYKTSELTYYSFFQNKNWILRDIITCHCERLLNIVAQEKCGTHESIRSVPTISSLILD